METIRKILAVLTGVLYVFLGIYLLVNPLLNLATISWMIALAIFMGAVFSLYVYFSIPRALREPVLLLRGILELLFGLYLLSYGYISLPIVLPTILAIWLISGAITGLIRANRLRSITPSFANYLLWISLAGLVIGFILLWHPLFASSLLATLLALSFLYQGIVYFIESIKAFSKN